MDRDLDGVYFRVKRDDTFKTICFSDLTTEERELVMDGKSTAWLKSLCNILAETLKQIGDEFDLTGNEYYED